RASLIRRRSRAARCKTRPRSRACYSPPKRSLPSYRRRKKLLQCPAAEWVAWAEWITKSSVVAVYTARTNYSSRVRNGPAVLFLRIGGSIFRQSHPLAASFASNHEWATRSDGLSLGGPSCNCVIWMQSLANDG